jgi:hypothetical protein
MYNNLIDVKKNHVRMAKKHVINDSPHGVFNPIFKVLSTSLA